MDCSTQTTAWSFNELQNHVKFQKFNLQNFKKIVENEIMSIVEDTCLVKEEYDEESDVEEEESDVEEEDIDEEINTFLKQQKQKKEAFLKAEQEDPFARAGGLDHGQDADESLRHARRTPRSRDSALRAGRGELYHRGRDLR